MEQKQTTFKKNELLLSQEKSSQYWIIQVEKCHQAWKVHSHLFESYTPQKWKDVFELWSHWQKSLVALKKHKDKYWKEEKIKQIKVLVDWSERLENKKIAHLSIKAVEMIKEVMEDVVGLDWEKNEKNTCDGAWKEILINSCMWSNHLAMQQVWCHYLEKHQNENLQDLWDRSWSRACAYGRVAALKQIKEWSIHAKQPVQCHRWEDESFKMACEFQRWEVIKFLIFEFNIKKTSEIERFLNQFKNKDEAEKIKGMFVSQKEWQLLREDLKDSNVQQDLSAGVEKNKIKRL